MILLIDNYDSFVFNLARYVAELGCEPHVVRNDAVTVDDVRRLQPQAMIISPGPCTPGKAGVSVELVRAVSCDIPLLGVCLGHQAIAAALGGRVIRAPEPVHGRTSRIEHAGEGLFRNLPNPLRAARYHSLIVEESSLPGDLAITARTVDGIPMALRHRRRPLYGVQFHPESVLTQSGHTLLRNFLELAGLATSGVAAGDFAEPQQADDWQTAAPLLDPPLRWPSPLPAS